MGEMRIMIPEGSQTLARGKRNATPGTMKNLFRTAAFLALTASAWAEKPTVGADLKFVADVAAMQPGVPFTVALHIQHHKGFHTYWKAPGIVGVPTSIEWKLPEGFKAGPIQWPAPRIVDMATHPAHGFRRDVFLLVEITPPKKIAHDPVTLEGDLMWMACSNVCHFGVGSRRITLPVNKDAKARPDPVWAPKIAEARAKLPGPTKLWTVTVESKQDQSPIRIRVRPQEGAGTAGRIYFFSEDGQISSEPPQEAKLMEDGSYLIVAERSEYSPKKKTSLPGTLVAACCWDVENKLHAFRAEPKYP